MGKVLTKADLALYLKQHDPTLSIAVATQLIDAFFDEIICALEQGDFVKLSGLGNFQVRSKGARPGQNPKTGEKMVVLPRNVILFQASQKLKAALKGATVRSESR